MSSSTIEPSPRPQSTLARSGTAPRQATKPTALPGERDINLVIATLRQAQLVLDRLHILPDSSLFLRVPQEIGRVIRHHHRYLAACYVDSMRLAAQARDAGVSSQQRLRRKAPHHDNQRRRDKLDLTQ